MLAIHGLTYNVQGSLQMNRIVQEHHCTLVVQKKSLKDNILTFNTGGARTNKVRIWILEKSRYFHGCWKNWEQESKHRVGVMCVRF